MKERVEEILNCQTSYEFDTLGAMGLIRDLWAENQELEQTRLALLNKLGDNCCACSVDNSTDVCMVHTPELNAAQKRERIYREALNNIANYEGVFSASQSETIRNIHAMAEQALNTEVK